MLLKPPASNQTTSGGLSNPGFKPAAPQPSHPPMSRLDPRLKAPLEHALEGCIESAASLIPRLRTSLSWRDHLGALRVRLGIGRNRYRVEPGLFAVGSPQPTSPVLVSANYKLSLDALRKELGGLDAWILVIDTKGINVWCAAGKGSFGNEEIGRRIVSSRLALVVSHRELILPQLAGPGVSAWKLAKETGWKVRFGPVRAADLSSWLAGGKKASPAMRRVEFGLRDRLVLIPVDVAAVFPRSLLLALLLFLLALGGRLLGEDFRRGLTMPGGLLTGLARALSAAGAAWFSIAGAFLSGSALVPLLLPWLPFRSFAAKGAILGVLSTCSMWFLLQPGLLGSMAMILGLPMLSAHAALAFTGSTTYTSLSGVEKEVHALRLAGPLLMGLGALASLPVIAGWLR